MVATKQNCQTGNKTSSFADKLNYPKPFFMGYLTSNPISSSNISWRHQHY